ncbi:MAG: hypothetical protein Q4F41_19015 [Eubacteriales bacterium]|nr:hypothetical protein [Eubacteriales bacterium]
MLYFTDAVTLQVRLINGIRETGRSMAVAAAAKGIAGIEDSEDLGFAGTAISSVYAKQAIQKEAETSAEHILEGGISLLGSSFLENEMIDLKVSGKLKIPVPFFNIRPIRFWQRGVVRAWTGRIPGETGAGEDGNGDGAAFAYVTVNGSVYHKDANCTHIRLSIKQVGVEQVKDLRSADGSKYYPCSCYKHSAQSTVYITREGNRYHSSLECGGLKRSVKKVTMSEAEHLRACSRCGG